VAKIPPGVGPRYPQLVVLVGATGDLSRRKLLPGLFHLSRAGFIPGCRIVGVSLDDLDADGFRAFARGALDEFSTRKVEETDWTAFAESLDYVSMAARPAFSRRRWKRRSGSWAAKPSRALSERAAQCRPVGRAAAGEADLVERSRIIMEKAVRHGFGQRGVAECQAA